MGNLAPIHIIRAVTASNSEKLNEVTDSIKSLIESTSSYGDAHIMTVHEGTICLDNVLRFSVLMKMKVLHRIYKYRNRRNEIDISSTFDGVSYSL